MGWVDSLSLSLSHLSFSLHFLVCFCLLIIQFFFFLPRYKCHFCSLSSLLFLYCFSLSLSQSLSLSLSLWFPPLQTKLYFPACSGPFLPSIHAHTHTHTHTHQLFNPPLLFLPFQKSHPISLYIFIKTLSLSLSPSPPFPFKDWIFVWPSSPFLLSFSEFFLAHLRPLSPTCKLLLFSSILLGHLGFCYFTSTSMLIESLLAQKEALPLLLWLLKEEDHYKGKCFPFFKIHTGFYPSLTWIISDASQHLFLFHRFGFVTVTCCLLDMCVLFPYM